MVISTSRYGEGESLTMNISSLQNINNFLPTQKTNSTVDKNSDNVIGNQDIPSFAQVLSGVSENISDVSDMFFAPRVASFRAE